MKGKDGFELDSKWAQEPRSYISIGSTYRQMISSFLDLMTSLVEHMPNYFSTEFGS